MVSLMSLRMKHPTDITTSMSQNSGHGDAHIYHSGYGTICLHTPITSNYVSDKKTQYTYYRWNSFLCLKVAPDELPGWCNNDFWFCTLSCLYHHSPVCIHSNGIVYCPMKSSPIKSSSSTLNLTRASSGKLIWNSKLSSKSGLKPGK